MNAKQNWLKAKEEVDRQRMYEGSSTKSGNKQYQNEVDAARAYISELEQKLKPEANGGSLSALVDELVEAYGEPNSEAVERLRAVFAEADRRADVEQRQKEKRQAEGKEALKKLRHRVNESVSWRESLTLKQDELYSIASALNQMDLNS